MVVSGSDASGRQKRGAAGTGRAAGAVGGGGGGAAAVLAGGGVNGSSSATTSTGARSGTGSGTGTGRTMQQGVLPDENLWVIHGKRYDLRPLMATHPGGVTPLVYARGRDATELFESYHALSSKPHAMMHRYLAEDQADVPPPVFDWTPGATPVWTDLKREVRAYFDNGGRDVGAESAGAGTSKGAGAGKGAGTGKAAGGATRVLGHKETVGSWATHAFFTVVSLLALRGWYYGEWWSLAVLPWAYWLGPSHMMHSGTHSALSTVPWVNLVCSYTGSAHVSIHDWMHQVCGLCRMLHVACRKQHGARRTPHAARPRSACAVALAYL